MRELLKVIVFILLMFTIVAYIELNKPRKANIRYEDEKLEAIRQVCDSLNMRLIDCCH